MATVEHCVGSSAVRVGDVHPIGKADADREEDGQASTVVGRLEAILASFDGCDHALGPERDQPPGRPAQVDGAPAGEPVVRGGLAGAEQRRLPSRPQAPRARQRRPAADRPARGRVQAPPLARLAHRPGRAPGHPRPRRGGVPRPGDDDPGLAAHPGRRPEPAYCTALGKVMLAFEDPAGQASALAGMRRRTEFTIVEPRAIQATLDSARQTGIAYDREEAYRGLGCVASPIRSGGPGDRSRLADRADRADTGALTRPRGTQHRPGDLVG